MAHARTASSKTLIEGMNQVKVAPRDVPSARKRELDEKIAATCQQGS